MIEQTRLLTVGEVALRLRQSPRTVRDKISAGLIPAIKIGNGPRAPIRIDSGELESWLYGTPPRGSRRPGGEAAPRPPSPRPTDGGDQA